MQGYGERLGEGLELSKYLHGDTLSAEDIALCSLAGPAVLPRLYCEGRFTGYVPPLPPPLCVCVSLSLSYSVHCEPLPFLPRTLTNYPSLYYLYYLYYHY